MPAFPFLFKVVAQPGPMDKAVSLPPQFAPTAGTVVATQEALDLVAYLTSLDHTYPVTAAASGTSP
jgi:cytochrome c oxidase cbb3-type subunit II